MRRYWHHAQHAPGIFPARTHAACPRPWGVICFSACQWQASVAALEHSHTSAQCFSQTTRRTGPPDASPCVLQPQFYDSILSQQGNHDMEGLGLKLLQTAMAVLGTRTPPGAARARPAWSSTWQRPTYRKARSARGARCTRHTGSCGVAALRGPARDEGFSCDCIAVDGAGAGAGGCAQAKVQPPGARASGHACALPPAGVPRAPCARLRDCP